MRGVKGFSILINMALNVRLRSRWRREADEGGGSGPLDPTKCRWSLLGLHRQAGRHLLCRLHQQPTPGIVRTSPALHEGIRPCDAKSKRILNSPAHQLSGTVHTQFAEGLHFSAETCSCHWTRWGAGICHLFRVIVVCLEVKNVL